MTDNIAGHFCGQTQPHAAHAWQTPQVYGSTQLVFQHQCAGISVQREDDATVERVARAISASWTGTSASWEECRLLPVTRAGWLSAARAGLAAYHMGACS